MTTTNDDILSLPRLIASLKREKLIVAIVTFLMIGLALLYVVMATPLYVAKTSILLDPAKAASVSEISSKATSRFDAPAMLSRIEVIKSRRVAMKAYELLQAQQVVPSLIANNMVDEGVLNAFREGLRVYREGESYVLTIQYTAENPQTAALYANAFADAYVNDQLNSFAEDAGKAEVWLKDKIDTLRQQSIAANAALLDFRQDNNIISTRSGSVNDQQLTNINDRLGDAKANVASSRVKYQHARSIIDKNDINAAVAQAFDNDVINNIRSEYLSDNQRLLKLSRTLGGDHDTVKDLKRKLSESRKVIFSEMKRIAQSYKNEYEVALAQESSLKNNLDKLIDTKMDNDGQTFELEALEKEAESYASLYDEYLKKYEMMQQQQSFPVAEASIISKAIAPAGKSHPQSAIIMVLSLILGLGGGSILALVKDNMDMTFKRAGHVESATGLNFLGFLPKGIKRFAASNASSFANSRYSQSVDEPNSLQAETCNHINVALQRKENNQNVVIGVSADVPDASKSELAGNLALHLAQSGHKCLLIDADARNPDLTEENLGYVQKSLYQVLSGNASLDEAIILDTQTNLYILASELNIAVEKRTLVHTKAMVELVEAAKKQFDYVVVNLPSMATASDASFSVSYVDYFLFVLKWAKSKPNEFNFMLKTNEMPKDKVLGVVLGDADMKRMAKDYGHRNHNA